MAGPEQTPDPDPDGYEQEGVENRSSVPLDLDGDGEAESVIAQQAVGAENVLGGGEFPDRDTPPQPAAKGYRPRDDEGD
jgi:hypothetical protein